MIGLLDIEKPPFMTPGERTSIVFGAVAMNLHWGTTWIASFIGPAQAKGIIGVIGIGGATALLIAVIRLSARRHHWSKLVKAGRVCPACGYDLRATPGRCPECGRDIGNTTTSI